MAAAAMEGTRKEEDSIKDGGTTLKRIEIKGNKKTKSEKVGNGERLYW